MDGNSRPFPFPRLVTPLALAAALALALTAPATAGGTLPPLPGTVAATSDSSGAWPPWRDSGAPTPVPELAALGTTGAVPPYLTAPSFVVGGNPTCCLLEDLDRDGALDLIVTDLSDSLVRVLPGRGDGTFAPAFEIRLAAPASWLTAADFDGDGWTEVVASLYGLPGGLVLLRSDGAGSLTTVGTALEGVPFLFVTSGDLDADGHPDLAATRRAMAGNQVEVLLGDGTGAFVAHQLCEVGLYSFAIAIGDTDGDGDPDLNVTSECGDIFTLRNDGHATFAPAIGCGTPFPPMYALFGPFLGGGRQGLAVGGDSELAFLDRVDGVLTPVSGCWVGAGVIAMSVGDFNSDGIQDLVTANWTGGTVTFAYGNTYGGHIPDDDFETGRHTAFVAAGDIDGDGTPEAVTVAYSEGRVSILDRGPHGRFRALRHIPTGDAPLALASGDLDRDGEPDLAVADYNLDSVYVLLRRRGVLGLAGRFEVGREPHSIATADFDGDGRLDLVTTSRLDNEFSVSRGRGDGSFEPRTRYHTGPGPWDVAAGDLDRDGDLDVAIAAYGGVGMIIYHLNRGDGTFGDPVVLYLAPGPTGVVIADLNGDGLNDIAGANYEGESVGVALGRSGGFTPTTLFATPPGPWRLVAAQVTGTPALDLVVACRKSDYVTVLENHGLGTFPTRVDYPANHFPSDVAVADLDGDGVLDIAVSNAQLSQATLLMGMSTGGFEAPVAVPTGYSPEAVLPVWPAGAILPELCTANAGSGSVTVLTTEEADVATVRPARTLQVAVLGPPSPNPVSGTCRIALTLPREGDARMSVHDVSGRLVRVLLSGRLAAGTRNVTWDGRDEAGRGVPAGLYFIGLDVAGTRRTARLVVTR